VRDLLHRVQTTLAEGASAEVTARDVLGWYRGLGKAAV
jgi:hypothetical protein